MDEIKMADEVKIVCDEFNFEIIENKKILKWKNNLIDKKNKKNLTNYLNL